MARKVKTMSVDIRFFNNIFEMERMKMQKKIGINNLSQPNFTKMIKGFKMKQPKQDLSKLNIKIKRKNVKI